MIKQFSKSSSYLSIHIKSFQPHQSCELMEEISDSNHGENNNIKSPGAFTKNRKRLHAQSFETGCIYKQRRIFNKINTTNQKSMGVSGPPGTPPGSVPDSNYGNNCHTVIANCAYSQKYKGVVPQQNGHWGAQLYANNQRIWLGTFESALDAAIAYDRASINLRSSDAQRNFPWSETTDLEVKFQSHYNMGEILAMIKGGSYESKFNDFLREKIDKENDDDLSVQKNCDIIRKPLFEKLLTPSDVGKLNRLVIPKKFAVAYFPPVPDNDQSEGFVNDEVILPFYDVHHKLWNFRYCYWKSSQSFVFTRGWNKFVKEKGLMAKDKIFFYYNEDLRRPNSGYLEIGTSLPPTSNSGASLKLGMETQVRYVESKEDEGIVEDQEMSDEVIQTSNNVETKGFKLFGVHIMTS